VQGALQRAFLLQLEVVHLFNLLHVIEHLLRIPRRLHSPLLFAFARYFRQNLQIGACFHKQLCEYLLLHL